VKDGRRTKLSEKSDPDYVSKFLSQDKAEKRRITVNLYEKIVQVFVDGVKLMEVGDESFSCGKAGFFSDKSAGFMIDDIEIASITEKEKAGKNEKIERFKTRKCRIINSVLDSFAATGGNHPGIYNNSVQDVPLSEFMKKELGLKKAEEKASVYDFQWLDFQNAFYPVYGSSQKEGYIKTSEAKNNSAELKYLWNSDGLLYGDFEFNFKVKGDGEIFGVGFKDEINEKQMINCIFNAQKGGLVLKNIGDENDIAAGKFDWKTGEWNYFSIIRKNKELIFRCNGKSFVSCKDIINGELYRPAMFYTNGHFQWDTIQVYVEPDLFYDFQYAVPYGLALSDWMKGFDNLEFRGFYYGYMSLKNANGAAFLKSKRLFEGNIVVDFLINMEQTSNFDVILKDSDSSENIEIRTQGDRACLLKNGKLLKEAKLYNFSTENRFLTSVKVVKIGNRLKVYLSDEIGNQRLVAEVEAMDINGKYSVEARGAPKLQIRQIMIWGKEAE
jgi:hypothetical protein